LSNKINNQLVFYNNICLIKRKKWLIPVPDNKPYKMVGIEMTFSNEEPEFLNSNVIEDGSPLYKTIESALDKYNSANPNKHILMPKKLLTSDDFSTSYVPKNDTLIIAEKDVDRLSTDELEAVVIHELGHKGIFRYGNPKIPSYSTEDHVRMVERELYEKCAKSGLSNEEIKMLLPSDTNIQNAIATDIDLLIKSKIEVQDISARPAVENSESKNIVSENEQLKWFKSPIDMLWAKYKASGECEAAIDNVYKTQDAAFNETLKDALAILRNNELISDAANKKTGTANAMCEALKKYHTRESSSEKIKPVFYSYDEEAAKDFDHPTLDARLKALDCPVPKIDHKKHGRY